MYAIHESPRATLHRPHAGAGCEETPPPVVDAKDNTFEQQNEENAEKS